MVKMGREAQHILPKNWGVKVSKIYIKIMEIATSCTKDYGIFHIF